MQKDQMGMGWKFDNSYARLPKNFFTVLNPTPVRSPKLIILNTSLADSLGLNVRALESEDGIAVFAGNYVPEGAMPLAQAYAGHQFGYFTMLGDGRAILLGEQITPTGERFDLQLKGSGRTPYSRRGDGRAVLGPMLREYIISEAMHALGIPSTRSLAVVTTGEPVYRETEQRGAILTRVASSHLRVGTFEYVAKWGAEGDIKKIADYTLWRHFPDFKEVENPYFFLLKEVVKRQAMLIAKWQTVGFVHGVMNTDNMALSGETIDYGPCAFMNNFALSTVFSSIDTYGRYAYGNQPHIAGWNLARFAETILPLLHENQHKAIELAEESVSDFYALYRKYWLEVMRAKLGMFDEEDNDEALFEELLNIMQQYGADYTNTFRGLTFQTSEDSVLHNTAAFNKWYQMWQERLTSQQKTWEESQNLMKQNNPAVIPRNHMVEAALEAAVENDDLSVMSELLEILSAPYAHTQKQAEYARLPVHANCGYRTFCGT